MRIGFFAVVGIILSFAGGCATGGDRPRGVEITTLRVRGGFVEIRTGPEGRSFSVLDDEGRILAADLSPKELETLYPTHFNTLKRGLAGSDADAPLDARAPGPYAELDARGDW